MTPSYNLRRSNRVRTATEKVRSILVDSPRITKRRSPRLTALRINRNTFDADTVQTRMPTRIVTITTTKTCITRFIDDGGSEVSGSAGSSTSDTVEEITDDDCDSDFDTSCPSSPESEEHVGLTGDNIEYMAADPRDRRESYDSRLEEGNEDYLHDDFIVGDSSEDEVSTAGSEITIANDPDKTSSETDSNTMIIPRRKRKLISRAPVRKVFEISMASPGSGLFVTDDGEPTSMAFFPVTEVAYKAVGIDVEPVDVAEEIMDAICRFSRRCNHLCPPLRLELTSDLLDDEEVADAMQRGVNQGLGSCVKIDDGRVLYTVGPLSK